MKITLHLSPEAALCFTRAYARSGLGPPTPSSQRYFATGLFHSAAEAAALASGPVRVWPAGRFEYHTWSAAEQAEFTTLHRLLQGLPPPAAARIQ